MWSVARLLLPTLMVAAELAVGLAPPTAVRINPDGSEVEVPMYTASALNYYPGMLPSHSYHRAHNDGVEAPQYSRNWCGAKANTSQHHNNITFVTAHFTVPLLSVHALEPLPQMAEAWVGIGGDTCRHPSTYIQAGVHSTIDTQNGTTVQNNTMFVRVWPGFSYTVDLHIEAEDYFETSIDLRDTGYVHIYTGDLTRANNETYVSQFRVNLPLDPGQVCPGDVEWVVSTGNEGKAFAWFAPVKFYNATATRQDNSTIDIAHANLVWLEDDSGDLKCSSQRKDDDPQSVGLIRQN
ncbi:Concanavalin A-like lectin/glucanase domain containing protein [Naviculisporaceae sp. PSN 640]